MNNNHGNTYTIKQVAKLSGVSVRTLHFYDEIGLLKPAYYGENGYRFYEQKELLLLQQILFYRELKFELAVIQKMMADPKFDVTAALRTHREQLSNEAARTQALIQTIDKTLAHYEKEIPMKDDEIYFGFDAKKQTEYEKQVIERWGEPARDKITESKGRTKGWSKSDYEKTQHDYDDIHRALVSEIKQGKPIDAPDVQAVVQKHYDIVCRFWTPNKVAYIELGKSYCDHPDFRAMYDGFDPKLAEYLSQAMKVFADRKLN